MTNNITSEWLIEELSDFLYTFSDTKSGTFVTKANELLRAYNKDRDDLVSDLIAFATNQQRMDLDIGLLELFENSVLLKEVREQSNKSAECSSIHASLNESHFDKSSMEIVESSFNDSLTFKRGSTAGETIHPKYAALTPVKNSKSNIEYQQRTDSGKVVIKYKGKSFSEHRSGEKYGNVQIENLCENMDTLKYYGNDKEVEQVDAICSRIEILKDAILDGVSNGFLHFQQCDHVSHDEFAIYGQIVEENGESLDFSNCCLQTNDETGTTIKLELENLSEFALFPGKVVAFRGYNETGSLFTATTIHEPKILDMAAITSEKGVRAQVEIWCAAGPFTSPDTFSFEQFYDLLEMARNERPDVLILIAPFIDRNSSVSNSPDLMLTWQEMFECLLVNISDMMVKSNVSVVLIPICRVDANSLPIYPTPPFHISSECRALLNKNVMLLTDPCKIRICGVSFMITSAEILKHLSKEEIHRCESGKEGDRMSRLIQHLIRQRSPYPLYPSSLEIPVIPARLINTYSFEAIPHIMLLPSALAPMVKTVNGCVCVNPCILARGKGGSFVRMCLNVMDAVQQKSNSMEDFCDVKIVRI